MEALEYLRAELGVRQAQARYADAVFRKDFAAFGNCLTDDSEWRVAGQVLRGREDCAAFVKDRTAAQRWVLMTFRTPILEARDKMASARTYVTEQSTFLDGSETCTVATYYERFAEQDGIWRRAWALFQLHYMGPADFSGRFFAQPDYGPPPAMPPDAADSAPSIRK